MPAGSDPAQNVHRVQASSHGDPRWEPVSVLVVESDPDLRLRLQRILEPRCALVETAADTTTGEELRRRCHFDLFVVSVGLPSASGVDWLEHFRDDAVRADVIFVSDYADLATAIGALRAGASDLLIKPFQPEQLLQAVERCLRRRRMIRDSFLLRQRAEAVPHCEGIIGESPAMQQIFRVVERVAPTGATVLLEGETGTGKELIARAIHRASGRSGPFVAVNCGSISADLLESELFGHTKGAFTGAHTAREGLFAHAENGTVLLDEIAEMPLAMQANLLRVLEQRAVRPVGADRESPVNCRILAATNVRLDDRVAQGQFREDLYYRLNVLKIDVPPLRERPEDIAPLVKHIAKTLARDLGVSFLPFEHADLVRLQEYHWPGNVRELRNLIERSLLLGELPRNGWPKPVSGDMDETRGAPTETGFPLDWSLEEVEKQHMLNVLERVGGNKSEAARRLGVSRKTMERKLAAWKASGLEE